MCLKPFAKSPARKPNLPTEFECQRGLGHCSLLRTSVRDPHDWNHTLVTPTIESRVAERVVAGKPAPYSDTGTTQPEPAQQTAPEADGDFDPEVYRAASKCIDPNFDPMRAASDDDYFWSYDGCDDISCPYHGDPEDPDFNPNDHHY